MGTDQGELVRTHGRQFRVQRNDCGSGLFLIQNDDSQLPVLAYGDVVKFRIDGSVARFAMLVERKRIAKVSQGEEHGEVTEVSGRGTLAVLEEAVVFPEFPVGDDRVLPSSDARVFNFSSSYLSDASWAWATENDSSDYGVPQDWPDVNVGTWIWDRDVTASNVPIGDCYFRKSFSLAADERVQIHVAADDLYEVWVDNQLVLEEDRWYAGQSQNVQVDLDSGSHLIAIKAHNVNVAKAGLKVAVFGLDANNEADTSDVKVESDATWKVLGYPAGPPGFTIGKILDVLLDEARARGALTDVTVGFSDTRDSANSLWDIEVNSSFRFGMDYLAVIRQIAAAGYAEFSMRADTLILDAFNVVFPGVTPVTLAKGTNIGDMTIEEEV